MATIEKRGQFWRVKIRRAGLPAQTRTFDNRTQAGGPGMRSRGRAMSAQRSIWPLSRAPCSSYPGWPRHHCATWSHWIF